MNDERQATLKALNDLGDTPSPADVDNIIGNGTWTATECDECGELDADVVIVGQEQDHESSTAWICKNCLKEALDLIE